MARDQQGGSPLTASIAAALGVLAVIAVLGVTATAGVTLTDQDSDPTPSEPASASGSPTEDETDQDEEATFFPDGQVLTGDRRDNADLEVPSADEGWVDNSGLIIGYESRDGESLAAVEDPYLFDEGFCTNEDGFEDSQAFVGFGAPISETTGDDRVRDALDSTLDRWQPATYEADPDYPEVDYGTTTISDGTPAQSATYRFEITVRRDRCDAPAVELRLLAFETGEYVAVVVLSRNVRADGSDLPDGLSSDDADQILASARRQGTG